MTGRGEDLLVGCHGPTERRDPTLDDHQLVEQGLDVLKADET